MTMTVRQNSFGGGEISQEIDGRTDFTRYPISLRTALNFLVSKYGSLDNRPGLQFCGSTKVPAKKSRLRHFQFGASQNFVLEFGDLYVRFFLTGGLVLVGGAPLEVVTPYTETDLPNLKFSQSRDVVTITCIGHDPMELRRNSNTDWVLSACDFVAPEQKYIDGINPPIHDFFVEFTPHDLSGVARIYDYAISMVLKDSRGRVVETRASSFTSVGAAILAHALVEPTYDYESATVYKRGTTMKTASAVWLCLIENQAHNPLDAGNESYWDQIGSPAWVSTTDYVVPGPSNANGYAKIRSSEQYLYTNIHVASNLNHDPVNSPTYWQPTRMSLLAGRGRLTYLPDMPITLNWPGIQPPAGYELVSYRLYRGEQAALPDAIVPPFIRSTYFLLTELDPTEVKFTDDGSTPIDITRTPRTGENPLANDPPETVSEFDQRRVFGRRNELIISAVGDFYNLEQPRTVLADSATRLILSSGEYEEIRWLKALRALLLGTSVTTPWVVSGAGGASDPFKADNFVARGQERYGAAVLDPLVVEKDLIIVEAVGSRVRSARFDVGSDGYGSRDLSVMAEHLFEAGGIIDATYQRLPYSSMFYPTEDGRLLGLTYFPEQELIAWHWHKTNGFFESACTIQEGNEYVTYVVVRRELPSGTVRYVERFAPRVTKTTDWSNVIYLDSALTYSGPPDTQFHELDHLEGMTVRILADGEVGGLYTVVNGSIDVSDEFPDGVSKAVVGLPYISQMETLGALDKQVDLVKRRSQVKSVKLKVSRSRGFLVAASDYRDQDDLDLTPVNREEMAPWREWMQRTVAAGYGAMRFFSGVVEVSIPDKMNYGARVRVRQEDPLPLSILSLERELEVAD